MTLLATKMPSAGQQTDPVQAVIDGRLQYARPRVLEHIHPEAIARDTLAFVS
jgi:hypothetical protein